MNTYKTKNLHEAGYLFVMGYPPEMEKDQNGIFWFIFPAECEIKSKEYWNKTGEVSAKEFADALRNLKDRIFAQK